MKLIATSTRNNGHGGTDTLTIEAENVAAMDLEAAKDLARQVDNYWAKRGTPDLSA